MKANNDQFLEQNFPIDYRTDIVSQIFTNLEKNESFSLIGIEDGCKSNVVRFALFRPDVQQHYLQQSADNFLYVYIDLNELTELTAVNLYQLMQASLIETMGRQHIQGISCDHTITHTAFIKPLKDFLAEIIQHTGKNIVFAFNDFDLTNKMGIDLLARNLVALRNVSRYAISYIFIGTRPFSPPEFFFKKVIYMTPFSGSDALGVVMRNADRYHASISAKQAKEIIRQSGGHPGLIKFLIQDSQATENIAFQCKRILSPLTDVEIAKLRSHQRDEMLINIGLQTTSQIHRPFSPLLETYLQSTPSNVKPFVIDKENDEIYFLDTPLSKRLSPKETCTLKLLIENYDKVIQREDIIDHVWAKNTIPSEWAFDKSISRLRQKIGDPTGQYIRTIKGVGIYLANQT